MLSRAFDALLLFLVLMLRHLFDIHEFFILGVLFYPVDCSIGFAQPYGALAPSFAFERLIVESGGSLNFVQSIILYSLDQACSFTVT